MWRTESHFLYVYTGLHERIRILIHTQKKKQKQKKKQQKKKKKTDATNADVYARCIRLRTYGFLVLCID